MKQLSRLFLALIALLSFSLAYGQSLIFNNQVPASLSVCENEEGFRIQFRNNFGKKIRNIYIRVDFPNGVEYNGNLENNSNWQASEYYVSSPNEAWFRINQLPKNKKASFSFDGIALPAALNGNNFYNQIRVYFQDGSNNGSWWFYYVDTYTDNYEINLANLQITTVSPMSNTVVVNQPFARSIVIENTGDGKISNFDVRDIHGSDLVLESVNIGAINGAGNSITLSNADFQSVGNGDNYFDPGESITINEVLRATGCNSTQSEIYTQFGCDGVNYDGNSVFPLTTITSPAPILSAMPQPSFNTCVNGNPDQQILIVENTGSGVAQNLELDIFQYAGGGYEDIFSRVDVNNIFYKINNGSFQFIAPSQTFNTNNSGVFSCLGNNAKGRFILQLPDLNTGDVLTIRWMSYTCAVDYCGDIDLIGWKYELDYEGSCGNSNFELDGVGQENKGKNISTISQSPSNIVDGDSEVFEFTLSSVDFDLPSGNDAQFELTIEIPSELTLPNGTSEVNFSNNNISWNPINISESNGQLVAIYELPAPFNLSGSKISFSLGLDCNATTPPTSNGDVDVDLNLSYIMDSNCSNPYKMPLICESETTTLECSGVCSKGVIFDDFSLKRTTFGQPDNDQDGIADGSGSINLNNVVLDRVMVGDEFTATFTGTVKTSWNYPSFNYGYASSQITNGDNIELVSVDVSVYDYSADETLICNDVPYSSSISNGILTTDFDLSIPMLLSNGCLAFSGFQFENNDVISLTPVYKVIGNIGANIDDITFNNEFYVSAIANPSNTAFQFSCGNQNGDISIIGYEYLVDGNENLSVNDCTIRVGQNFHFGVGNCCDNGSWSDLFPYEFRNWSLVNQAVVEIPEGYAVENIFLRQNRLGLNDQIVTQNHPLSPVNVNGNIYTLDLSQALNSNGGTINEGDGSFDGSLFFDLRPECDLAQNVGELVNWDFNFQESALLEGNITSSFVGADQLTYQRADLQLSSNNQTIDGIEKMATWEVEVTNSSNSNAENSWISIESISNNITIDKVIDLSNNMQLFEVNGLYQIGLVNANSTKNIRIEAEYNTCVTDDLQLNVGYDCLAYPIDLASANCGYSNYSVSVNPQDAEMNATLNSDFKGDDNNSFNTVEIEVSSIGASYLKDLTITLEGPPSNSLLLQADSTEFEYPINSGFEPITTPAINGANYAFTDADLDVDIYKDGLPGLSDPTSNSFKLRFNVEFQPNFSSGDVFVVKLMLKNHVVSLCQQLNLLMIQTRCLDKLPELEFLGVETTGD